MITTMKTIHILETLHLIWSILSVSGQKRLLSSDSHHCDCDSSSDMINNVYCSALINETELAQVVCCRQFLCDWMKCSLSSCNKQDYRACFRLSRLKGPCHSTETWTCDVRWPLGATSKEWLIPGRCPLLAERGACYQHPVKREKPSPVMLWYAFDRGETLTNSVNKSLHFYMVSVTRQTHK